VFGAALAVFAGADAAAALTPSFEVLLGLRVLAAAAAATATPALFAVAATLAPEGRQGRYSCRRGRSRPCLRSPPSSASSPWPSSPSPRRRPAACSL
jgi:hypothetical protein